MLVTNKYSIDDVDKYKYSKYEDNSCVVIYLYVDDMFDMKILGKTSVLLGFSNAIWILNLDDMKSTYGNVFIHSWRAVSWKFTKQICITWFTMEVEFIALENVSSEGEWLGNLLTNIPLWTRLV